jgi:hypothetical protein
MQMLPTWLGSLNESLHEYSSMGAFIRILKEVRQLNEEAHVGSTKFQENTTCELAVPRPAN